MADDDVTRWLESLREGDEAGAQAIWERYFDDLVCVARRKLKGLPRRAADEEDVALSAMHSFYRGLAAGRFPQLTDRQGLWRLLVTITVHKALSQVRRHRAQKRGAGNVRGESVFVQAKSSNCHLGIDQAPGKQQTPELAALLAEQCERLLTCLQDASLQQVAQLKLAGYSNEQIARELGCVPRTIERKLRRIREKWERERAS
jgi:RNA polymerase sigma factor (sigma-70 family)